MDLQTENIQNILKKNRLLDYGVEKKVQQQSPPLFKLEKTLRTPICCVFGHVDTGKTSFLDKIRNSNYQEKEAGGITQQIGSTFFPIEHIYNLTKNIKGRFEYVPTISGILMIDTPGHSEFEHLRIRGSEMCDMGILLIDINIGIDDNTKTVISLLKKNKIPFIIVPNKIDTLTDWKIIDDYDLRTTLKQQSKETNQELEYKLLDIKYELQKLEIDSEFYFKNKTPEKTYSIVPISSKYGNGVNDIFAVMIYLSQKWMAKKLIFDNTKFKAVIMEETNDSIYVIIQYGKLSVGDEYYVCTINGVKKTSIKNILVPKNLSLLGNKTTYQYVSSVMGSIGVKIICSENNIISGTQLYKNIDNANEEMKKHKTNKIILNDEGILICAKNNSDLEALYELFTKSNVSIKHAFIGFNEIDSMKIQQLKSNEKKNNVFISYGVKINKNPDDFKVIESDVLYKLFEEYEKYMSDIKIEQSKSIVFPCSLEILRKYIFMKGGNDNLLFGVKIKQGVLNVNTPVITDNNVELGKVINIQQNHKDIQTAKTGDEVCIRLSNPKNVVIDKHFSDKNMLISQLTRNDIDILKKDFRDVLTKNDWYLVSNIMDTLKIKKLNE